jgi:hypothetical protein
MKIIDLGETFVKKFAVDSFGFFGVPVFCKVLKLILFGIYLFIYCCVIILVQILIWAFSEYLFCNINRFSGYFI